MDYPKMALNDAIIDHLNSGIFAVNQDMEVCLWNRFMELNSGRAAHEVLGKNLFECFPELPAKWLTRKISNVFLLGNFAFTSWEQRPFLFRFPHNRPVTGGVEHMLQDSHFFPVKSTEGEVQYVCVSIFDVTDTGLYQDLLKKKNEEQRLLIHQLEEAKSQLLQSEKMAAIGQLAAGVAHEINNPIAFVASNLSALRGYAADLLQLIECYEQAESHLQDKLEVVQSIAAAKQKSDLAYLREDIPGMLDETDDGLRRVRRIVQDLKDFSRPDSAGWGWSDLHTGLDSTLNVVRNEIKYKADIVKEYGDLPQVECIIAQMNQVFMNLIVNAAQAIDAHGTITMRTGIRGEEVWVEISDTGKGIDPPDRSRLFDPFFTTKPVGQGTGLGLSVSHGIVEKHNGRIEVESEIGKGTTFRVWLPIKRSDHALPQKDVRFG